MFPHPPIWSGGNSRAAIRRSVDRADGWLPFATPPGLSGVVKTGSIESLGELAKRMTYLDQYCSEVGRETRPHICFAPRSSDVAELADEIAGAIELGVDSVTLTPVGNNLDEWTDDAERRLDLIG